MSNKVLIFQNLTFMWHVRVHEQIIYKCVKIHVAILTMIVGIYIKSIITVLVYAMESLIKPTILDKYDWTRYDARYLGININNVYPLFNDMFLVMTFWESHIILKL